MEAAGFSTTLNKSAKLHGLPNYQKTVIFHENKSIRW